MRKYDFETLVNRAHAGSGKWELRKKYVEDVSDDIVPFSVADMDLVNPPEIIEGLKDYLDHTVLGYTGATDAYYDSVIGFMERHHGFSPKKEWFVETAGIVPALNDMVKVFTEPEDAVLIMTPVYYPFTSAIVNNGRKVVETELIPNGRTYDIDFEDFRGKAAREDVTLMIISSPHNPMGKVFTREEIEKICEICYENHVFLISDEIHFDLIMPGFEHVSVGTMEEKYLMNCAICTAPSKTFNLAGLQTSNVFVPNPEYREKCSSAKGYRSLNIFGYKACELAYTKCDEWLEALIEHLDGNKKYMEQFMAEFVPEAKVYELQGTYLMWIDFNGLGMTKEGLEAFMTKKALLFLDEGYLFGEGGSGFERINLACPRWVLEEAMGRLKAALEEYRANR